LFELFGDGALLSLGKLHAVLRDQYVEVGLRHAHDQILFRSLELRLGLRDLQFSLSVSHPILLAEQRLSQGDAIAIAVELGRTIGEGKSTDIGDKESTTILNPVVVVGAVGVQIHAGQQQGTPLRQLLLSGALGCPRRCENRILRLRRMIDFEQVRRFRKGGGAQ
jgi:hypothetical protein